MLLLCILYLPCWAFLDYVEKRADIGKLAALKQVFVSGEALNLPQVNTFNRLLYSANGTELYNLYGPTEAAVDVSYFDCSPKSDFENSTDRQTDW